MKRYQDKISADWPGWFILLFLTNLLVKTLPLFRGIMIHPDAPVYLWSAQSLERGNIAEAITAYPMLFYPFLVMCVHKLGLDWLAAGRTISVAASCLALFPFFSLAKRFSPGWPAIIITMVFVLLPEYNSIAFAAIRDPLYLCMALFAIYTALRFAEGGGLKWLPVALLTTLCLPLLRVEGIALSLVISVWGSISFVRRFTNFFWGWAVAVMAGVFCLLLFLFSLSPTGRNLIRLDEALSILQDLRTTPQAVTFYLTKLDELAHTNVPFGFGNNFWQVIERNWQWIYGIGMLRMFENNLSLPLLVLGFFGVKSVIRDPGNGILLSSVFLANILVILANYYYSGAMEGRIMLFPAILWLFFAGAGLPAVGGYLVAKGVIGPAKIKQAVILPLSILLTLPFAYKTAFMDYNIHIPVLRDACLWVRNQVLHKEKNWKVIVNMRTIAWFLDRRDAEQISPATNRVVLTSLGSHKKTEEKSTMIVLLLSRRNKEDMMFMESLDGLRAVESRIFTDPEDKKNVVVALWQI